MRTQKMVKEKESNEKSAKKVKFNNKLSGKERGRGKGKRFVICIHAHVYLSRCIDSHHFFALESDRQKNMMRKE